MEEEEEGVAEATHDFWKKGKRVEERRAKKKDVFTKGNLFYYKRKRVSRSERRGSN